MKLAFFAPCLRAVWALPLLAGVAQGQSGTPTITQATGGGEHSCAVTTAGAMKCWGYNLLGQLGIGANSQNVPFPADVQTLGSGVATIATGYNHTCAVTDQGAVKCWGSGSSGRLGNGSTASSPTPVDVLTLGQGAVAVTAGDYHTCALTDRGAVKCWGWNQYGQLGSATNAGTDDANTSPLDVQTLGSGVVAIAASLSFTCALTNGGAVKCWGINDSGQLGNTANLGTDNANSVPLTVQGLASGATAIAVGESHACALLDSGMVKCWGLNNWGQIGSATNAGTLTPNPVPLDVWTSNITRIAAGLDHTCVVNDQGAPFCWGRNNLGQLGVAANAGTENPTWQPVMIWNPVATLVAAAGVNAGHAHTCVHTTTGALRCWGSNSSGQLGNMTSLGSYNAGPLVVQGFDIPANGQSITFTAPQKLRLNTSVALSAGATSGGTVSFDTWSANTCAVAGNTLSPAAGATDGMLCGVRASQHGSNSVAAAPRQLRLVRIVREDRLTVGVTGQGTVAAAPAPAAGNGISTCTAANSPCVATYVAGDATAVTLTATPAAHWHITGWNGNCTVDGANPLQASLNLAGDKTCNATFAIDTVTANVTVVSGNGTVTPPSRTVNYGDTTTFAVNPAAGHQATVTGCGGSLTGTTYTTGALTANCAITATFVALVPNLTLTIDANRDYVGYGQVLTYTVSLTNSGKGAANPASIALTLPPQIDAGATTWTCTNGGNGALCAASGSGALQDSAVVLPPGRTLTWRVTAPVLANAPGGSVVTSANASAGAVVANGSDSVVLVLMRDGFEATGSGGR